MKNKIQIMIMCAVIGVIFACADASYGQMVGGFKSVSVTDDRVKAAAEFAVSDFSEKNEVSYEIVSIEHAEQQVVQGMNYRICIQIKVSDEGNTDTQFVLIQVYQDLKRSYKLTSWKADACGGE